MSKRKTDADKLYDHVLKIASEAATALELLDKGPPPGINKRVFIDCIMALKQTRLQGGLLLASILEQKAKADHE